MGTGLCSLLSEMGAGCCLVDVAVREISVEASKSLNGERDSQVALSVSM